MKKLFGKIDALPIVRLLQLLAVIILIVALTQIAIYFYQAVTGSFEITLASFFNALIVSAMTLGRALFEPAFLLGLAEIIKLMKEKNAKNK